MAFQEKKFLDAEGVTHLVKLLDEYPNNQILGSVIDAIEGELAEKAEKNEIPEVPVQDVQVNGMSVLTNGIANVPTGDYNTYGVIKLQQYGGLQIGSTNMLKTDPASEEALKRGTDGSRPIIPSRQHVSAFYGLAKAAGHDEKDSTEPFGAYTSEAKGAIQSMLGVSDLIAPAENNLVASKAYAIGDIFTANGKLYKATAAIAQDAAIIPSVAGEDISGANCVETNLANENIKDVQVNGTSIIQNGIANMPMASASIPGVVKTSIAYGTAVLPDSSIIKLEQATSAQVKDGTQGYKPIVPERQHESVFYGLAKAAGADMASSSNAVGTYTDEAKAAIQAMLGIDLSSIASQVEIPLVETVSGAAVIITGQPNTRYMCGEVTSISITPPAAGSIDVVFTSGSTVAVLTLPSTVKMPEWFDASTLDTNTVYEILITDGLYGSVMTWAT